MADDNPYDELFSAEQWTKYNALIGKRFVRVDPQSRKPQPDWKDYFWMVDDMTPTTLVNGDMNKPFMDLVVQPYYRNKTYEAAIDQEGGGKMTKHVAFHFTNRKGELTAPGFTKIAIDRFKDEFAPEAG
jgi:hypothetical protein